MLNILKLKRPPTIIHALLQSLNVKFTNLHLMEHISQHPNAGNMLGVSDILYGYNIENISLKISGEDFDKLEPPFLAQLQLQKNEFALITDNKKEAIIYISEAGIKNEETKEAFFKLWTGVVLLPEATDKSGEKEYALNRRKQWIAKLRLPIVVIVCVAIICWLVYNNSSNISIRPIAFYLLLLLYSTGIVICILLLMQSIDKNNPLINKICGLAKTGGNCNDVLESPAAKLWGIVSWGEVGFVYFAGNLLSLAAIPTSSSLLFWINILALPYTFWSIYYQWKVVKQWCVLCLSIQTLLWLGFVLYFLGGAQLNVIGLPLSAFIPVVLCFLLQVAVLLFAMPFIKKAGRLPTAMQELNSLKANETVFDAALKTQKHATIEGLNKAIVFGNTAAPFIITMVTNPFCGPCETMHKRLEKILLQYHDHMQLQIIYLINSFEKTEHNTAVKQLIAAYLDYGAVAAEDIYSNWYKGGNTAPMEDFLKKYPANTEREKVQQIFESHKKWGDDIGIQGTPTIYVNGYELPGWYKVEDLKYFILQ